MKKWICIYLVMLVCCFAPFVYAETIIESEYVTYSSEKTDQTNVKGALDELIEKVDSINTGGTAEEDDIAEGETAYVQGKLITGTKKTNPVYWKTAANNSIYLDNSEVTLTATTESDVDVLYVNYGSSYSTKLKTCTSAQMLMHYELIQVSSDVVAVYWGIKQTVKETSSDTDTSYSYNYQYYVYDYITTFIASNGTLTKVSTITVSSGNGNTTDYAGYMTEVDTYSYNYNTGANSSTTRSISTGIGESIIPWSTHNVKYYNISAIINYSYYSSSDENNSYDQTSYWYQTFSINIYTGAAALASSATRAGTAYYTYRDPAVYANVYDYELGSSGLIRLQYDNTSHDNVTNYLFYDWYATTVVSSVTETYADGNGAAIRDYSYVFHSQNSYPFNYYFTYSNQTLTARLYSSIFGSTSVAAAYPVAGAKIYSYSDSFSFSNILPEGVTLSKTYASFYSELSNEVYLTITCSDGGKMYVILGVSDLYYPQGKGLNFVLQSAAYRKNEDGSLVSTKRIRAGSGYGNDQLIKFYR